MGSSRIRNTVRNTITGFINKFCMILFPFVIRTLMIRYMGAEYLGLNSLFTSILQVLSLAELGISSAIVYCMYKPIAEGDTETICALYNLIKKVYHIIGIIILIVGSALIPFLDHFISGEVPTGIDIYVLYIIYLLNTVISYFLFAYKECLFVAHQRSDISNNIQTIMYIFMYLVQCVAIIVTKNYYVYIIALPICTILINIIKSYQVSKYFPEYVCRGKVDKKTMYGIAKRVCGLMLYKISGVCRTSFDSIVISAFLGLVVLAKYQNYYTIMSAVGSLTIIITTSATASIGDSMATESREKNYENFRTFSMLYSWLSGWCTACLLCLYQPFMKIWMGEEYMFPFGIVILFCIYFYTCKISDVAYTYRQAAGLWWEDKFRPIIEAVANLVLNIVTVKFFGVYGVIISTIITITFINIPWGSYILFNRYFRKSNVKYMIEILLHAIIALLACVCTWFVCNLLPEYGAMSFVVKTILCIIIPNMIFLLVYRHFKGFNEIMKIVKRVIKHR